MHKRWVCVFICVHLSLAIISSFFFFLSSFHFICFLVYFVLLFSALIGTIHEYWYFGVHSFYFFHSMLFIVLDCPRIYTFRFLFQFYFSSWDFKLSLLYIHDFVVFIHFICGMCVCKNHKFFSLALESMKICLFWLWKIFHWNFQK